MKAPLASVLIFGLITSIGFPFPASAAGNGVSISGIVYYSTTPLEGVQIELLQGDVTGTPLDTTYSAADGSYSFTNVSPGDYQIKKYSPFGTGNLWSAEPITVGTTDLVYDLYVQKEIKPLTPANNAQVESIHPYVCWEPLPEADYYTLQINQSSDWKLMDRGLGVTSNCYRIKADLENGVNYTWQVNADDANDHYIGYTVNEWTFTVNTTPITEQVLPLESKTIASLDQDTILNFPAGSFAVPVDVTYARNNEPIFNADYLSIDRSFEISATYSSDGSPAILQPGMTYSMILHYNDIELGNFQESSLVLCYWDGSQWIKEPTSVLDTDNNSLTATPNHFSRWAVLIELPGPYRVYIPVSMKK